jgi:hypothetical protein
MCATQLNPLVHSGVIAQYCVLNVTEFIVNTLGSGVKICILLGCNTAGPNPGDKIGTPVDISKIPGGPPPMEMNNNNFGNNSGAQPMYGGTCSGLMAQLRLISQVTILKRTSKATLAVL